MIAFDNTYARLPERFYARLDPTPVKAPALIAVNAALAQALGLDPAGIDADVVAGNRIPEGAAPIAEAYAGHQFGHFTPQLGDGRAILMGEVVAPDGTRRDLQWKGSGPTPFSRRGDGRAALGPVLREYLISEAMHALGVPTTRTLAAATTGEYVFREEALPGAVLIRVAASHIRVGTFQYFAARGDAEAVKLLADHAIARHYPEAAAAENPYLAFFEAVVARQAALIPHWLHLGFIHGVMNTDNCAVSGETIDYGPCAFLDAYEPGKVFSSIDQSGRYAYANQPRIAQWNLARLAETLLPLFSDDEKAAVEIAQAALAGFAPRFQAAYLAGLRTKCGLATEQEGDEALVQDLLQAMAESAADFTLTFRALAEAAEGRDTPLFAAWAEWAPRWRERLAIEKLPDRAARMRAVNPAFIPRNHRVEEAIAAAVQREDFSKFHRLLAVVTHPFAEQPEEAEYRLPPKPEEAVTQTFCGT